MTTCGIRSSCILTCIIGLMGMVPQASHAQLVATDWRILQVSSENLLTGERAHCLLDGDPETQWHTCWHDFKNNDAAKPPHSVAIDMRKRHDIVALRIRGRAHGEGGLPKEYLLETSLNAVEWQQVAEGTLTFRSRMSPHAIIELDEPTSARFVRLTVRSVQESAQNTEPGLVIGELDIATPAAPLLPTTLIPVPQSREWNYGGYVWRRRHSDLIAYAAKHKPRLVFLGDSITHRWGGPPFDSTLRTGEAVWTRYYGHRQALSLGYGWDRLENMLWRLQHGELEQTDPKLIVLMAGTNNLEVNTPDEIAAGVAGLCKEIHQQKPQAHILLLAIFPRGKQGTSPELETTNRLLSSLGKRPYITFKDIGSTFLNDQGVLTREIMPDLLHPGAEGYRRWAAAIEPDVAAVLGDSTVPETPQLP